MKVLTPGHRYTVTDYESGNEVQTIQFIHKKPGFSLPQTVSDGTTAEEVLAVLLDRMKFLQSTLPCAENASVISKLEESLSLLMTRTAGRVKREVEDTQVA